MDKGKDGDDAKAKEDNRNAQKIDDIALSWQLYRHELVSTLHQEEVKQDFATDVKY